jgi:penicillin amidase
LAQFPTEGLPLKGAVQVLWNDHQIPYIVAEHDEDAAFTLGLVHAHLRLGQIEMTRRVVQGRLAEAIGPEAIEIDRGLRTVGLDRSAKESVALMDPSTKAWTQSFVDGLNHYQSRMKEVTYEFKAMGVQPDPWTVEDIVTVGRLAGIDVTWIKWSALLPLRKSEEWPEIWARTKKEREQSPVSFPLSAGGVGGTPHSQPLVGEGSDDFSKLLRMISKSGSNSYVVGPKKTANGGAMIASDPHLGLLLPNLWLIVGVKSPSYNVVGMMAPGLPVFALGRNEHIAWGGTNLFGANSDLVDVSDLPKEQFQTEQHRLKVRLWPDQDIKVRVSPYGPVISDVPSLAGGEDLFALKWIGHNASDEIGALLDVARAENWLDFRASFDGFSLPSQNMLYADDQGNIGQLIATQLPSRRASHDYALIRSPEAVRADWDKIVGSSVLPHSLNPSTGFLASSNNRPTDQSDLLIGYFFGAPDRISRVQSVLSRAENLTVEDLSLLQRDVFMASSLTFRDTLLRRIEEVGYEADSPALDAIRSWKGHYDADSKEALAFEAFFGPFVASAYRLSGKTLEFETLKESGQIKWAANELIQDMPDDLFRDLMSGALLNAEMVLAKHETWGDLHRLRLAHPFALVPDVDQEFLKIDLPVGGSSETLMKTAHAPATEKHSAFYGSQSRHISDLSDKDANYFVLVGGQDGWINSSTFADQVTLWQEGKYIQMPLDQDVVRKQFAHRLDLVP